MLKQSIISVYTLVVLLAAAAMPEPAGAQVRIRFRPYLGLGAAHVLSRAIPDIAIEDEFDQLYYDRNYKQAPGLTLRATVRADLIHVYDLSFGYQFWGHRHIYPEDAPDNMFKIGVDYPSRFSLSLHAVTAQWTLGYRYISSRWFVPFITAGYGPYFGTAKSHHYEWITTDETVADKFFDRTAEYEGRGVMLGFGGIFFRYVFIHMNYIDLGDRTIPHNRFLELTVGGTL
ncbi:hypothetical protein JXO52_00890 [bacterium]|nr:hypothetical protein [bacterium]